MRLRFLTLIVFAFFTLVQCTTTSLPISSKSMKFEANSLHLQCLRDYVKTHQKIDPEGYVFCRSHLKIPQSELNNGLYAQEVQDSIMLQLDDVRTCYKKARQVQSELKGNLVTTWQINSTGHTQDVKIKKGTISDKIMKGCVVDAIQSWIFPARSTKVVKISSYPFIFNTID